MTQDTTSKHDHSALDRALQQIEKSFGKGAIMKLNENGALVRDGVSTGALSLDLALGGYGIPRTDPYALTAAQRRQLLAYACHHGASPAGRV